MPLIRGIGDEVLCAALVAAAPLVLIWRASTGFPLRCARGSLSVVRQLATSLWMRTRGWLGRGRGREILRRPAGAGAGASATRVPIDAPPEADICPVCHDAFSLPCQANCSHWFCGECILRVWEHGSMLAPCRCPLCRRPVTLLLPSQAAALQPEGESGRRVVQDVAKYNRLFAGGPVSLWQRLRDMPLLLRRLAWEFSDVQRALRLLHNARIAFCLVVVMLYVLSPFDFIPECIMGVLGLLDDALLLLFVAYQVSIFYRATLLAGHLASAEANPRGME